MSDNYVNFCSDTFGNDNNPVMYTDGSLRIVWRNDAAGRYEVGETPEDCFNPPLTLPLEDKLYYGSFRGKTAELRVSAVRDGENVGYLIRFSPEDDLRTLFSKDYVTEYVEAVISRINTSVHAVSAVCADINETYAEHGIKGKKTGLNIIDGNCRLLTKKAQEMNGFLSLITCRHEYDRPVNLTEILYNEEYVLKNILTGKQIKLTFKLEDNLFVNTNARLLSALLYNITEMLFTRRMLMDDVTVTAARSGDTAEVTIGGKNTNGAFLEGSPLYKTCDAADRNRLNSLTNVFVKLFCSEFGCSFKVLESCDYAAGYRLCLPAADNREIVLNSSSMLGNLTGSYDTSFHPLRIKLTDVLDLTNYL